VPTRILSIAANTFRETVRNKILYAILAFALLVIGLSWFLANLSVGEVMRIIVDVGLASIQFFGVVMAVFIGITLVNQEMEKRTVYLILSKPVRRWEFIVGKAAGLSGTLALITLVMAIVLFLVHRAYGGKPEPGIFIACAGIYMELVLLICLASLFSTFTTPVLSAIFTLAMFLVGHVSRDLLYFGGGSDMPAVRWLSKGIFYALPNLEIFNWKNEAVYGSLRSAAALLDAGGYLVCYGGAVLLLACILFAGKDFK
jgi:ABC-type transport system involved in multi-copper enzyme maturation permease subunit